MKKPTLDPDMKKWTETQLLNELFKATARCNRRQKSLDAAEKIRKELWKEENRRRSI